MLNNGVFGDTGGQMTATTVLGQRTKTSLDGRDAEQHGYPIPVADLVAQLEGAAYVARGAVKNAGVHRADEADAAARLRTRSCAGEGFSLVEILTMCPTGWFVPAAAGATYLGDSMEAVYGLGEIAVAREVGAGA